MRTLTLFYEKNTIILFYVHHGFITAETESTYTRFISKVRHPYLISCIGIIWNV